MHGIYAQMNDAQPYQGVGERSEPHSMKTVLVVNDSLRFHFKGFWLLGNNNNYRMCISGIWNWVYFVTMHSHEGLELDL